MQLIKVVYFLLILIHYILHIYFNLKDFEIFIIKGFCLFFITKIYHIYQNLYIAIHIYALKKEYIIILK